MFTKRNYINNNHRKNALEILVYAVAAIVLVGQVLFVNGTVGYLNTILVMLGVVFATMTIYQLTPISNWLTGDDLATPADILMFSKPETDKQQNDVTRHAA